MTSKLKPKLETKAASGSSDDVATAFDEFMRAFEAFRETNDERLAQIETAVGADVVTTEKMARIDRALDEHKARLDQLVLKNHRPAIETGESRSLVRSEHKAAFDAYIRRGRENGLRGIESKALYYDAEGEGGYLVPDETANEIGRRLAKISPIRAIAGVQVVSSAVYKKPFAISGPATGWVAETDARTQTTEPGLAELQFPTMEIYAMPAATPTLLEDAAVDVDSWIASEVETAFAEQESTAFVSGNGTNKPTGFLSYTTVAEASWEWGKLGHILSGVDGGFAAEDPSDTLIETIYALKAGYRQNAHWVMNRSTQAEIRKFKDADGNYLWQPPASVGEKAMLMGFPLVESEDMPDMSADTLSIAFGDFSRGYLIVDRAGVRVLRDPYSAKPYVLFYTTKRVGGGVQDFDAIKLIKFGDA